MFWLNICINNVDSKKEKNMQKEREKNKIIFDWLLYGIALQFVCTFHFLCMQRKFGFSWNHFKELNHILSKKQIHRKCIHMKQIIGIFLIKEFTSWCSCFWYRSLTTVLLKLQRNYMNTEEAYKLRLLFLHTNGSCIIRSASCNAYKLFRYIFINT